MTKLNEEEHSLSSTRSAKGSVITEKADRLPVTDSPETNVPLDAIAERIKFVSGTIDRQNNRLILPINSGQCVIDARSVNLFTVDGQEISEIISIKSDLPEQMPDLNDKQITVFNTLTALGALIRDKDTGDLNMHSRLSIFKGDDASWQLYTPLIVSIALLQSDALLNAIMQQIGLETINLNLPEHDQPSRWSDAEFDFAAFQLNQIGVLAFAGEYNLSAELPLAPDAVSAINGDKTSLLQIKSDTIHPAVGSGLFYKLELPTWFEEHELVYFANKLNQIEMKSSDAPPFVGAWCSQLDSGRLSYVGFWPNLLYQPGSTFNIAIWMLHRNKQVWAWIENIRNS